MTDPLNLDDLRANLQGATPRPWSEEYIWSLLRYGRKHDLFDDSPEGTNEPEECDAAIIVAAVNALPQLLNELERLRYADEGMKRWRERAERLEVEVERLRGLLRDEQRRMRLVSLPAKLAFMRERGMKSVLEVEEWMMDVCGRIAAACGEVKS